MEYSEFKEKILDVTPETEGLLYNFAVVWLHPERLPLAAVHLGNCTDRIIKIPNWSGPKRVVQSANGPWEVKGPSVPIISFSKHLFKGNIHITDVVLQSNIGGIPTGAFEGCSRLQRITIPKSVKYIGEATFKGCSNLQDVYYAGTEEEWKKIVIVHDGAKPKEPMKLGLHVEIEHFVIPGNEPLLNAKIHFNCDPDATQVSGVTIIAAGKDITGMFRL